LVVSLSFERNIHMKTMNLLAIGLIATLAAACGGSDKPAAPTTTTLSCLQAADGYCIAVTGTPTAADIASFNADCAAPPAGVLGTGCPTASRIGTCTLSAAVGTVVFSFYPPTLQADAVADCTALSGTWHPG
jgi:hypothetical protein